MAAKTYRGPIIDATFDAEVCAHAGECVRGMPEVFNVDARPWINGDVANTPEAAQKLRDVISRCPSGALKVIEHPHSVDD